MANKLSVEERLLALESDIKNTPRSGELEDLIRDLVLSEDFMREFANRLKNIQP